MSCRCTKCGSVSSKWTGRCLNCQEWGTIVEDLGPSASESRKGFGQIEKSTKTLEVATLSKLAGSKTKRMRIPTELPDINSLLGGGFVEGQTVLLSGEPGVGKSTLALQIADSIKIPTLYVSGEETIEQLADRAKRICRKNSTVSLSHGTDVAAIASTARKNKTKLLVIDSAQTLDYKNAKAGSTTFIREAIAELVRFAKRSGTIIIVVGQVTKAGDIAGPKSLEHLVDTVLFIEGERSGELRIARCLKNRYGKTDSVVVFQMNEHGMKSIKDPSTVFVEDSTVNQVGVAKTVAIEGQIPLAIEVQSLIATIAFSLPKRTVNGLQYNKLFILVGALEKYSSLRLGSFDVFVNIAGGISTKDPSSDLAVCASIYSSAKEVAIPGNYFFFGEIELSGRVRPPQRLLPRLEVAHKCGARTVLIGKLPGNQSFGAEARAKARNEGIRIIEISNIRELTSLFRSFRTKTGTKRR